MAALVGAIIFVILVAGVQTYVLWWAVRRIEELQERVKVLEADAGITCEWLGRKDGNR